MTTRGTLFSKPLLWQRPDLPLFAPFPALAHFLGKLKRRWGHPAGSRESELEFQALGHSRRHSCRPVQSRPAHRHSPVNKNISSCVEGPRGL